MALRNIVLNDDPILRKRSRPVTEIDDRIRSILEDMVETMRDREGVGLAAVQVGVLRRMFVVEWDGKVYQLINPEIVEEEGTVIEEEACLSVPGFAGMVERPEKVRIKALNKWGEPVEYVAEGMLAKAFCHENDHLNGILYTDLAEEIWAIKKSNGSGDGDNG
ncbi:MAG: peptide deformylase [Anaerovoracaceae bacterium]|jgi:peptide deformylase